MPKTNRGKSLMLQMAYQGLALPSQYYFYLCTSAVAPTLDTELFGDLTEIPDGNGYDYASPFTHAPNSTNFFGLFEDDINDWSTLTIISPSWTASGGPLPATGGARYLVMTWDDPVKSLRQVMEWWDLGADQSVLDGEAFTVEDPQLRLKEG